MLLTTHAPRVFPLWESLSLWPMCCHVMQPRLVPAAAASPQSPLRPQSRSNSPNALNSQVPLSVVSFKIVFSSPVLQFTNKVNSCQVSDVHALLIPCLTLISTFPWMRSRMVPVRLQGVHPCRKRSAGSAHDSFSPATLRLSQV